MSLSLSASLNPATVDAGEVSQLTVVAANSGLDPVDVLELVVNDSGAVRVQEHPGGPAVRVPAGGSVTFLYEVRGYETASISVTAYNRDGTTSTDSSTLYVV